MHPFLLTPSISRRIASATILTLAAACSCPAATYYVATTGSDSNFGTLSAPFATVNRALTAMVPGDTVFIRGGTYVQSVTAAKSGTASLRLTIAGYPGETAVIDGGGTIPSGDGTYPLISITGNYVTVQDLTTQNAYGMGLQISGSWNQAIRIKSYRNWSSGIRITTGSYNSVEDSEIYWNARSNDRSTGNVAQYWGAGLTCSRGGVNNTAFRRNKIWNNWGEGMSTFESTYTTMEDNISWDNFANNIYLSDTQHALAQRNLAYYTPANVTSTGAQTNIEMGDETSNPPSSDNVVINNFAVGGSRVFSCCTGATNNVISNNSFINASSGAVANVQIWSSGTYTNAQFVNNIIEQDDSVPITSFASNPAGLTRSNNVWSKTPPASASGAGDVIGDPRLSKSGSTSAGSYSPDWFKLLSDSPAIHHES